jgi:hypothetical protein
MRLRTHAADPRWHLRPDPSNRIVWPLVGRQTRQACLDHFQIVGDYKWRIHNEGNRTLSSPRRLLNSLWVLQTLRSPVVPNALYEQRGCTHGYDLDDWLLAERDLGLTRRTTAA